mmetsp:Transcript_74059/g.205763  ORF Transcript_74059/g.205763 Transcript_74059/m.205763 type:complete len:183 (-) Transcript_74059:237-785(-)
MAKPVALSLEEVPEVRSCSADELLEKLRAGGTAVLDVRSDAEYAGGHIRGAVHVPHERLLDDGHDSCDALAAELLETWLREGKHDVVVHCMYCQARGPAVALRLAAVAGPPGGPAPIAVSQLTGGFHGLVNAVGPSAAEVLEDFDDACWRRTGSHGLIHNVDAENLEALGQQVGDEAASGAP